MSSGWGESESESENASEGVGRGKSFLSLLVVTLGEELFVFVSDYTLKMHDH